MKLGLIASIMKVDRAGTLVVALDSLSFIRKFTVKTREYDKQKVTFYQKYIIKALKNSIRLPKDTIGVLFLF